jgi:hypothetical protein
MRVGMFDMLLDDCNIVPVDVLIKQQLHRPIAEVCEHAPIHQISFTYANNDGLMVLKFWFCLNSLL